MLKEHKNRWFEVVSKIAKFWDIDISDFEGIERDDRTFIVQLRNTPFVFMIRQKADDYDYFTTNGTLFKPGFPLWKNAEEYDQDMSFYDVYSIDKQLGEWARNAIRYLAENKSPDLWTQLNTYSFFTSASSIPVEELQPFTDNEKTKIKASLLDFEERIIEKFDPLQEQLDFIKERLEYLSQAVDSLNRFDWKAQALSTLTSIAINLGVDTETGNQLLELFKQAFASITRYLRSGM
jgi:hypothetical protein